MGGVEESSRADREVVVMAQITKLFADLTRAEINRILEWAQARYVRAAIEELDVEFFARFTDAAVAAAKEIGEVTPHDLIAAFAKIQMAAENETTGAVT